MRKGLTKPQAQMIITAVTEDDKVRAAAEVMVETPLDLIKHILMKHEQAVIEVMREQQIRIKELEDTLKLLKVAIRVGGPEYGYDDWMDMIDTALEGEQ